MKIQILNLPFDPLYKVILVDADKGGSGKSCWTYVLAEWINNKKLKFIGIDCDQSNSNFLDHCGRIMHIEKGTLTEDQEQSWKTDNLMALPVEKETNIVADFAAQSSRSQKSYFLGDRRGLLIAKHYNILFIKFYLCAGYYSAEQFVDSVKTFGGEMPHVLVLNEGLCSDFSFLNEYEELQEVVEQYQIPILRFQKIPYRELMVMKTFRLSFSETIHSEHLNVAAKQCLIFYLRDHFEQIDQLKLFDHEK
ncbi:MAG: hypothetical protein F6J86_06670 [Symploca sp. SIO1B1]|nr:hypothetical protein [Symploca sp. SIO1B1]